MGLATLVLGIPMAHGADADQPALKHDGADTLVARACLLLARSEWPATPVARRDLLQRFEGARAQCLESAPFLASLGALWLEEGEPGQALIWLERALLLAPDSLGAQADHALALAALGEPAALAELARSWRDRSDLPPELRIKLGLGGAQRHAGLPVQRPNGRWASHREIALMAGYESNLDHSPRLTEITLTPPEGPIDLPLLTPLAPRPGAAVLADLSWQVAYSPQSDQVWRTGVRLGARGAPAQGSSDWHHLQWAASAHQRWGPWRGQLELGATWAGGPLNEPYRMLRLAAAGERDALGCRLRLALDVETKTPDDPLSFGGRTVGALWSSQCPLPATRYWAWGVALRAGLDRPTEADRPGGTQRLWSLGLRLTGPLGDFAPGVRLDGNLRAGRIQDDEGYSPLLENDAARRQDQLQLSLELSRRVNLDWLPGAEALVQWHALRQRSNLAVFRHSGSSLYTGLRWAW